MKVRFLGAARTVTGSCFMVETASARFAVDCGMYQGSDTLEKRNFNYQPYCPEQLDFIIITHAHIDHAGLLPLLVKHGFGGRIYASAPTVALLKIMLADSAHIQEIEAFWKNKKLLRNGGKPIAPIYTEADAQAVLPLLEAVGYNEPFSPVPSICITLQDAGHILGSAFVTLEDASGDTPLRVIFSGDIGRNNQLIVKNPTILTSADYLIMESTYGNRLHRDEDKSLEELGEAIAYSYARRGKVLIPAFAVERTQEILYALHLLSQRGLLPKDMPVFVDSPLAIRATEIFKNYRSFFDEETKAAFLAGEDPFMLPNLHYTLTTQESIAINSAELPAIIISASGMANAGRIKHHLRHNLWKESTAVVFVGFQANGTIGRKIVDGASSVRIFNEEIAVGAKVFTINGFSAHADQKQLLKWLGNFENRKMQIFLVHGEFATQEAFKQAIAERFNFPVHIPQYLEEVQLDGETRHYLQKSEKPPELIWAESFAEVETALQLLKKQLLKEEQQSTARTPEKQQAMQARFVEISNLISGLTTC